MRRPIARTSPVLQLGAAGFLLAAVALGPRALDAACCYFAAQDKDISQPGQMAFIQWRPEESIEAFTVEPRFEGNAVEFGMVIPTPGIPKLDEMPRDFFKDLAIYTILLPVAKPVRAPGDPDADFDSQGRSSRLQNEKSRMESGESGVLVLESGIVGSLDYKIISAADPQGLFEWLKANGYSYGGDEKTLDSYIRKVWYFTVMKIDPKQMKRKADGSYVGDVTPTRFTFSSKECVYPLKITQISVKEMTDALFYVQAPAQMDLKGDWSWQHSFRVMELTYRLGCREDAEQQRELADRAQWIAARKQADPDFETTKLEWAHVLGFGEMAVLDDPLANYAQGGRTGLPPGTQLITVADFLKESQTMIEKRRGGADMVKQTMDALRLRFPENGGLMLKVDSPGGRFMPAPYLWLPNRTAPDEDVRGLTRLKGHLEAGRWLTKFRKRIRKEEMEDDLVLIPVDAGKEQEYVRALTTSPP